MSPSKAGDYNRSIAHCYRYLPVTGGEAVEMVIEGRWDMPDFQRAFVWRPSQVSDLADSLWRGYPIGNLLIWESTASAHGAAWIADGQQRLTSLCLLFGVQPPWWRRREMDRRNLIRHFDVRLDIGAATPPVFQCSFDGEIEDPTGRLISVAEILAHDPAREEGRAALREMALQLKRRGLCRSQTEDQVYEVMHRLCMVRHLPLCTTHVGSNLQDLLEIFSRLNSRGTRFRRLLLNFAMRSLVSVSRAGASTLRVPHARRLDQASGNGSSSHRNSMY